MYLRRDREPVTLGGRQSRYGDVTRTSTTLLAGMRARLVIALVFGRVARARFEQAIGRGDQLMFVGTIADLRELALGATLLVTIVSEARDENGAPTAPLLREIIAMRPATAIIGYCHARSASADILDLACAGIDELVQEGIDDEGIALRAAFTGSIEACAGRTVRDAIHHLIPFALRPLVDFCLQYPQEDHSVEGLSRALGVDRKTLLNHSHRLALPPPSTLAMWCRLLLAAAILESTGQSVEQVSLALEFASPSSFRNACRRYANERPSSWRTPGGLFRVLRRFEQDCERCRRR